MFQRRGRAGSSAGGSMRELETVSAGTDLDPREIGAVRQDDLGGDAGRDIARRTYIRPAARVHSHVDQPVRAVVLHGDVRSRPPPGRGAMRTRR